MPSFSQLTLIILPVDLFEASPWGNYWDDPRWCLL
jgi:hypothetical protein